MQKLLGASYRTSILGIIAIVTALTNAAQAIFDGDPATVFDLDTTIAAVAAGIGLIVARDKNVSSEAQGIKPQ